MNIIDLTVHELQEKLKNNEVTITEIMDAYINRINEKEPEVEAFITTYLEEAKAKARDVEDKVKRSEEHTSELQSLPRD